MHPSACAKHQTFTSHSPLFLRMFLLNIFDLYNFYNITHVIESIGYVMSRKLCVPSFPLQAHVSIINQHMMVSHIVNNNNILYNVSVGKC